MEQPTQPSEIARETIKRLAARKLPPTPENFQRVYTEVTGKEAERPSWPQTLRGFLKQWEAFQTGLTQNKKREMLDRVLINFGNDPDLLAIKLAALAKSWGEMPSSGTPLEGELPAEAEPAAAGSALRAAGGPAQAVEAAAGDPRLGQLVMDSLKDLTEGCGYRWPDLASRARSLSAAIAEADQLLDASHVSRLGILWREVLVRAEDDYEYIGGLKRLLALLFDNVGELVSEDAWLSGQISTMQAVIAGDLNTHALFQVERNLQEVVQKQKALKGSLNEAKEKLKQLISLFVNRVGEVSTSTGDYHVKIQEYSARIAQAEDIGQLSELMDSLSSDMLQMQNDMRRTHEELVEARVHVEEAQQRIQTLEKELDEVSSLVREDQLTGALNRRGMDEAFQREIARAARLSAPLTLSLLDIDHFKKINDSLGHQVGDEALVHLARVVRKLLRPTDVLARYGGEEFLILLPGTDLDEAEHVMQRVQRELTKEYFMHQNQKVLITFSAGVAQMLPGEDRDSLISRADAAMYRAKTLGRNRVEKA